MPASSNKINQILEKHESQLGKLVKQAHAIESLNQTLSSVVDSDLIAHCRVGSYHLGVLTLFTENSSWATKLRYDVPRIMSQLRSIPIWAGLCSIQIKIQTNWYQDVAAQMAVKNAESPFLKPSKNNAAQFQALADSLRGQPGMEKLVESLERLARSS